MVDSVFDDEGSSDFVPEPAPVSEIVCELFGLAHANLMRLRNPRQKRHQRRQRPRKLHPRK